jgi:hypothetical protein
MLPDSIGARCGPSTETYLKAEKRRMGRDAGNDLLAKTWLVMHRRGIIGKRRSIALFAKAAALGITGTVAILSAVDARIAPRIHSWLY